MVSVSLLSSWNEKMKSMKSTEMLRGGSLQSVFKIICQLGSQYIRTKCIEHSCSQAVFPFQPTQSKSCYFTLFSFRVWHIVCSVNHLNKENTHYYSFALQKSLQKKIWLHIMSVFALQTKVIGALLTQGSWQPHQINFIFHGVNWQWHFIWGTGDRFSNLWKSLTA